MTYAITPTLWVGLDRPTDVSGFFHVYASSVHDGDDYSTDAAHRIRELDTSVVVPDLESARAVLYELGLTPDEVDDRMSYGMREVI